MSRAFTIIEAEQRSPEWQAARLGRLTGSRADDMLARVKSGSGEAAARRDLRVQLVVERLTGTSQEDSYVSRDMQRGIDKEADAFAAYEAATGYLVRRTGFLQHRELMVGCSLDGDVDDFMGIVELKCPKSATHFGYWRAPGKVPTNHVPQILHNLWVTGAAWADFVSFDDRFPEQLRLFVARVTVNELELVSYMRAALAFLAEVDRDTAEAMRLSQELASCR